MDGLRNFTPGLDGKEIFAARDTYGDVAEFALYCATIPVPQPANFRQEYATVYLIQLELLWVWIAEAFILPFLSELRRANHSILTDLSTLQLLEAFEIIAPCSIQLFQCLLHWMNGGFGEPCRGGVIAPVR